MSNFDMQEEYVGITRIWYKSGTVRRDHFAEVVNL